MSKNVLAGCASGLVLVGLLFLTSCSYFVGTPVHLVPLPDEVSIEALPEILSCTATFAPRSCDDRFQRICGFYCWDHDEEEWRYCCRDVWQYTECVGDIVIRMTVNDPSGDLDPVKSPRVRVMDSQPVASTDEWDSCQLALLQTDVPISPYDVSGTDAVKTILVRIRDVPLRFTGSCRTYRAALPMTILFEDGGQALKSQNTCEALLEYGHR